MTKKHIDYEAESKRRITHLELTGGLATESLTVRDVFAAKALQGMLSDMTIQAPKETFAKEAYEMADAMLKQRENNDA